MKSVIVWLKNLFQKPVEKQAVVMGGSNSGFINTGTLRNSLVIIRDRSYSPNLQIPFTLLSEAQLTPMRLLRWSSRLPEKLIGRDAEFKRLQDWCNSDPALSMAVIEGGAGVGKTRLAFELADALRGEGWQAGQVKDLSREICFEHSDKGVLFVIDYPEEKVHEVSAFFEQLTLAELPGFRLRILLLCRQYERLQALHGVLSLNCASDLKPLHLRALEMQNPWELFQEVYPALLPWASLLLSKTVSADLHKLPVEQEQFEEWLQKDSNHSTPLMVQTLALSLALDNTQGIRAGSDLIRVLLEREQKLFSRHCKKMGWNVALQDGAWWLQVLCAITGKLSSEELQELHLQVSREGLGGRCFPSQEQWRELLGDLPLCAIQPDLFAAHALYSHKHLSELAASCLPALIQLGRTQPDYPQRLSERLDRLARLHWDCPESLLDQESPFIEVLFPLVTDLELLDAWFYCFAQQRLSPALFTLAVKYYQAKVQWQEVLYKENPSTYGAHLAGSLSNLSAYLGDSGEHEAGLEAVEWAVEIREGLAVQDFWVYGADLASSLLNLSNRLGALGKYEAGLEAIERAVEIYKKLAVQNFGVYGAGLARGLNNLSNCLGDLGKYEAGLEVIKQAVEIRERLAIQNFVAYGADLASSLLNLSNRLGELGNHEAGLGMIERAVEIYEKLAAQNFEAYGVDLARGLNNLSNRLGDLGRNEAGLEAIKRAVEIRKRLAAQNFVAYGADLATSLNNLSIRLGKMGEHEAGLEAIEWAVEIREKLVAQNFRACGADLASSLNNLSVCLRDLGRNEAALEASERACELIKPFATPGTRYAEWSVAMHNQRDRLRQALRKGPMLD